MSLFGFNQKQPVRMPSTHQAEIRVKKQSSTRSRQSSGREVKQAEKLPPSVSKESVERHTKGSEALKFEEMVSRMEQMEQKEQNIGNRFTMMEESVSRMEQKLDQTITRIEEGKEDRNVLKSEIFETKRQLAATRELLEQLRQQVGTFVTLEQVKQVVAEKTVNCEVQSPFVPSATVGAVEKDTGNWGSVLAASSVQAVERSKPEEKAEKVDTPKPKSKPRNKENVDKVVQTVERSKPEAEASPNPLWILLLALYLATPLCVFSVTRYRVYSADYDPR
jgi:hypothetical protein